MNSKSKALKGIKEKAMKMPVGEKRTKSLNEYQEKMRKSSPNFIAGGYYKK